MSGLNSFPVGDENGTEGCLRPSDGVPILRFSGREGVLFNMTEKRKSRSIGVDMVFKS